MKTMTLILLAMLTGGTLFAADPPPTPAPNTAAPPPSKFEWARDFQKALALAKQQGKLVMVDFYTDW